MAAPAPRAAVQRGGRSADARPASAPPPLRAEAGQFLLLTGVSVVAFYLIFPSWSLWWLAFVCLTPWTVAVCRTQRAWVAHWGSFLGGWAFFLVGLAWLMPVTGLGFVALAFYLALYWTLSAWAIRTGRRVGISPTWTLPVVWTACEYLRAWVMTGFPWLFVGHALYGQTPLIQISDLTGAYGVSFLALLVNGVLAEIWLLVEARRENSELRIAKNELEGRALRSGIRSSLFVIRNSLLVAAAFAATFVYGQFRLGQAELRDGPRVAVIQEDFPLVSRPPYGDHPYTVFARYLHLASLAARHEPDLIALPETVSSFPQNAEFLDVQRQAVDDESSVSWKVGKLFHEATSAFARGDYATANLPIEYMESELRRRPRQDGAPTLPRLAAEGGPPVTLIFGAVSIDVLPEAVYPRKKRFNSALIYDPDGTQRAERYDKMHLVPFGESVPFRNATFLGISLHPVYRMLNRLSPFSSGGTVEYSLWPGERATVFELNYDGRPARFGVPICYEDVMPYIARDFVWDGPRRRVDFLVNISNDGWFLHSDELPQHLAICVFRAVENRVAIARAVNTGISGFIDSNGRTFGLVERDGVVHGKGIIGYSVERIPLDDRSSFYGRFGDVFATACLLASMPLWIGGIVTRWVFAIGRHFRGAPSGSS